MANMNGKARKAIEWTAVALIASFLISFPKIIGGAKEMSRYISAPDIAEAAQQQIQDHEQWAVEWAAELRGYTQALQEQQMQMQQAPIQKQASFREQDNDGVFWCCDAYDYDRCWNDQLWFRC